MSWGGPKIFCDLTDPHWVCLGTHRHPWVLPNRYLQRANFVVFWAISGISKVNNTFYMYCDFKKYYLIRFLSLDNSICYMKKTT